MTEIGYYNYYNVQGRRVTDKPDDWYQKMVNRYESDELKSVDEMNNPYSDLNQSTHALDEKLASWAEGMRARFSNADDVDKYLCQKYFGQERIGYTKQWEEPEKYAMYKNDLNMVMYGTVKAYQFNLKDPRINNPQYNSADEFDAVEEKAKHDSISNNMAHLLENNGIDIGDNSLLISINPYSKGVMIEGMDDLNMKSILLKALENNNNSTNLLHYDTTVLSEEQRAIVEKAKVNGMNAGLNINSLHEQGITGKGVRIAIIDSAITDNPEFSDNILYNRNFAANIEPSAYHGNAISSVAVGKNCGVAPDAQLAFYSANTCAEQTKAIENVIIQNEEYKKNGEPLISVISISCGFDTCDDYEQNYGALREVIAKAKEAGIAVITCDDKEEYKHFAGADRNPQSNPDEISSYRADRFHRDGEWWNEKPEELKDQTIFIPAEHRTVADDYEGLRYEGAFGGASWTAPYIAGVFALAKQTKPDVTYEQFMEVMQKTADKMHNYDDGQYVGKLINPQAIINELTK